MTDKIKELSQQILPELIAIRRSIHQKPELAFEEHETCALICAYLDKWGIPYKIMAKTGVVGLIEGSKKGKTLALRADMDALPVTEENDIPYKSQNPGRMHACGHDAHVASLLGSAYILNSLKDSLKGNIKLIFQPAEEGVGGAQPMIEEGVMDNPRVDACLCAHVMSEVPVGSMLVKYGAIMASPDDFDLIIKGRGGHAAWPQHNIDPIVIAAAVINALQTIPSRRVAPTNPVVVSVCSIHGGTNYNVIPDSVHLKGTVRSVDPILRKQLPHMVEEIAAGVIKAMGGDYDFNFRFLYPPTINDMAITDLLAKAGKKILGEDKIIFATEPSMGGEDFSYFAELAPSSYFKIGVGNKGKGITYPIHSSRFNIDESALQHCCAVMSQFAVDYFV